MLAANTPGITSADITSFTFDHRPEKMFPFEQDAIFTSLRVLRSSDQIMKHFDKTVLLRSKASAISSRECIGLKEAVHAWARMGNKVRCIGHDKQNAPQLLPLRNELSVRPSFFARGVPTPMF